MTANTVVDVAVIGAGLAGLTCGQRLKQAGYQVVVIEKSRGLGGRLATRRLQNTCADHGVRYLNIQGKLTEQLIQTLLKLAVVQPWVEQIGAPLPSVTSEALIPTQTYTAPAGLTTVAKFLASGLEIWRGQRVQALAIDACWQIALDASNTEPPPPLLARSVVMAIPAPQALMLLKPLISAGLPAQLVQQVQSVQFDPCITAIAAYPPEKQAKLSELPWSARTFSDASDLAWISLENTKRPTVMPVVVAQSTAAFAECHLEAADLHSVGQQLLNAATHLATWLNAPAELQVHRWRYAFVRQPFPASCLMTALPLPLVCSGDWCGGNQIENALESGLAAAHQISQFLEQPAERKTIENANTESSESSDTTDWLQPGFQQLMHELTAL